MPIEAQYLHRGSLQYEFSTELLQTPIQLFKINNVQAQVLFYDFQKLSYAQKYVYLHYIKKNFPLNPVLLDCGGFESPGCPQCGKSP